MHSNDMSELPKHSLSTAGDEFPEEVYGAGVDVMGVEPDMDVVEIDNRLHEPGPARNVVVFEVPHAIQEARSAYSSSGTFNAAVNIYSREHNCTPEQALSDNLGMLLHVEEELLGGIGDVFESYQSISDRYSSIKPEQEPAEWETADSEQSANGATRVDTVADAKQLYVDGEIDILEFEDILEDVIAGGGND